VGERGDRQVVGRHVGIDRYRILVEDEVERARQLGDELAVAREAVATGNLPPLDRVGEGFPGLQVDVHLRGRAARVVRQPLAQLAEPRIRLAARVGPRAGERLAVVEESRAERAVG
jgi:hypothetical protein